MTEENDNVTLGNNDPGSPKSKRRRISTDTDGNEEKPRIEEPIATIQKIHNMCQELLEKQKNLEKSNMEIVEKLRLAEEKMEKSSKDLGLIKLKIDTIEQSLTNETSSESSDNNDAINSTTSSQQTTPSEVMSTDGKYFVLQHTFENVSSLKDKNKLSSEEEEHFGFQWRMLIQRNNDYLAYFLYNKKIRDIGDYSIFVEFEPKLSSLKLNKIGNRYNTVFDKTESWGILKFIEWKELEEDFSVNDKLSAEIRVKIKKTTGIYKENLRNFDETMKQFSDVVLVINATKFFVSKLYLATHSPYFNTLLLGHFQESKKSEITLTGIDEDDFQKYLEILYGEQPIDEFTVEGILLVADMYDTPLVVRKCEEFLLKKSKKSLKTKLRMSTRFNLELLKKKCLAKITSVTEIRSILPANIQDLDKSLIADLLEKSISFQ
ncbi:hypothetical protein GCK72_007494 [Caenorhabditis remanei]|uniref:BTB domain-containing protein n=1 Tax=Caenorhabditis remanei TaxID=31234 RepID=A0A6A5HJ72_CAERE|nr:hypothetical protein GCK72_007494 [Caenorhabditis remanei]KAF1767535.1 hypothetical protein GCK72_007494 [Caenorhabditis remanei]